MLPVLAENLTLIAIWNLQGSAVSNLTTEIHSLYISLWATAADTFSSFQKMMRKCAICFIFYYILKLNLTQCWSHYSFEKEWKWVTWYFIPNCSKWFMCIFMRFEIQTTFEFQGIYWNKVYHFSHRGLLLNLMAFHTQNSCLT